MELTEKERIAFEGKKTRLFKATIAVSVTYAVLCLGLLVAMYFNDAARELLTSTMAPFTFTFVIGMLLIIIWLVIEIYNFKPIKNATIDSDPYTCPDYFILERTPPEVLETIPEELQREMAFRCVPNKNVYSDKVFQDDSGNPVSTSYGDASGDNNYAVKKVIDNVENRLVNVPPEYQLKCDNIYPAFLHSKDIKDNKDEPNMYRCEFIGKNGCNMLNWSSICAHPKS